MSDSQTLIQDALGDKYEIRDLIQSGGMGKIFLGVHKALGKKVAIKIVHQELVKNEDFKARFFREAKLASGLDHPGIIDIYDFGSSGDFDYIIMPFIDGETIQSKIRREGGFHLDQAVRLVMEMAEALSHAHKRKVIHRDIKPSNIMLDSQGRVVITDFGISKDLGDSDLTAPNTVLGSPKFMSPEQIKGEPVGATSDLYSLGLVFYEMVTGKHPFQGKDTTAIYYAQAHEIPPRPETLAPAIPERLGSIIMGLLEKLPENRYPDCDSLLADLRGFLEGKPPAEPEPDDATIIDDGTIVDDGTMLESVRSVPAGPSPQPSGTGPDSGPAFLAAARKHRKIISAALAVFILLIAGFILFSGDPEKKEDPPVASIDPAVAVPADDERAAAKAAEETEPMETASLPRPETAPAAPRPDETSLFDRIKGLGNGNVAHNVRLWTDRDAYRIGQTISFHFQVEEPCYVLVLAYTTQRKLIQVFPNHYSAGQFVQPGRQYSVPSERMDFDLRVTGPEGTDSLVALVSNRPFDLLGSSFNESNPFLILDTQDSSTSSAIRNRIDSLQGQTFSQRQATYTIK